MTRKLTIMKGVKTIDDILVKDDIRAFVKGFLKDRMKDMESVLIVYVDKDERIQAGMSNFAPTDLFFILEVLKDEVLKHYMVDGVEYW